MKAMRIILALGNAQDTGGPTKYAMQLQRELGQRGHSAHIVSYGFEASLPSGMRHLLYAARLAFSALNADAIIGFDTMTVGLPALLASKATRTPFLIRIGGDFVWEQYVERTGDLVKLSRFYFDAKDRMSRKERIEISLTSAVVRHADALMFNTSWQRDLWRKVYGFAPERAHVVENYYPARKTPLPPAGRIFVAAGRAIKLKQEGMLTRIFDALAQRYPGISLDLRALPPAEHQERVSKCYAVILASVSDVAPNAIIDAVANGKPFICTQDTGIKERLAGVGAFVDTQNEEDVVHAVEALLNPQEYERAQEHIQNFVFVRTWADVTDDVLKLLKSV